MQKLNSRDDVMDTDLLILLLIHLQSKEEVCMLEKRCASVFTEWINQFSSL